MFRLISAFCRTLVFGLAFVLATAGVGQVAAAAAKKAGSERGGGLELVMFEQKACEWCAVWNEKIGPIYPKTDEGKRAPLRRVDIHETHPADLENVPSSRFTPTFVLVQNGQEYGRINGYPGEDFFWGLLGQMLKKHDRQIQRGDTK